MTKNSKRVAAVFAVLLAGSCAGPNSGNSPMADGAANHPITVEPATKSLQVSFSAGDAGLMPDDSARFDEFVQSYLSSDGTGAMNVSVPDGPGSAATIEYFGERLASAGVPRSRIMVGTHQGGNGHVELGYMAYVAHVDSCGDWSQNAGDTLSNMPMPNFGCSVQHNIAAQIDNPRDLVVPRAMGATDATRRNGVVTAYEKGTPTSATKTPDQSVAVSDVH
jgi:pilus assembly protein CpaD